MIRNATLSDLEFLIYIKLKGAIVEHGGLQTELPFLYV